MQLILCYKLLVETLPLLFELYKFNNMARVVGLALWHSTATLGLSS